MNDIVPIVMGGAVLEDKLVVPRTYINILDFPKRGDARTLFEIPRQQRYCL